MHTAALRAIAFNGAVSTGGWEGQQVVCWGWGWGDVDAPRLMIVKACGCGRNILTYRAAVDAGIVGGGFVGA
jgi:hypothetical protein